MNPGGSAANEGGAAHPQRRRAGSAQHMHGGFIVIQFSSVARLVALEQECGKGKSVLQGHPLGLPSGGRRRGSLAALTQRPGGGGSTLLYCGRSSVWPIGRLDTVKLRLIPKNDPRYQPTVVRQWGLAESKARYGHKPRDGVATQPSGHLPRGGRAVGAAFCSTVSTYLHSRLMYTSATTVAVGLEGSETRRQWAATLHAAVGAAVCSTVLLRECRRLR